jgi:hypothetical protein
MKKYKMAYWGALAAGLLLLGVAIGFWLRGKADIEACLDHGGRWDYEMQVCDLPRAREGPSTPVP